MEIVKHIIIVRVAISILLRYHLFLSAESPVGFQKVASRTFGNYGAVKTFSPGLKAKKCIPPLTYLMTASGSMSSNEVTSASSERFVVPSQPGATTDKRFLLGPIRFISHSCRPNCEVS